MSLAGCCHIQVKWLSEVFTPLKLFFFTFSQITTTNSVHLYNILSVQEKPQWFIDKSAFGHHKP